MKYNPPSKAYFDTGIQDVTVTVTFWNTKFHYRIHNSLPQFHVLKETNLIPMLPRYLFILNTIQLSSKERSSVSRSFSSSDPHAFLKEAASFIRNGGRYVAECTASYLRTQRSIGRIPCKMSANQKHLSVPTERADPSKSRFIYRYLNCVTAPEIYIFKP